MPVERLRSDNARLWGVALTGWLATRVVVGVAWLLTTVPDRSGRSPVLGDRLAEGLLAWDGQWYLRIAGEGYRPGGEEIRFWPLFPALGRAVGWLVDDPGLGLVLVANLASVVALYLLARLVVTVSGDHGTAVRSVWALAVWPASFVLVFAYAESLLLAASLAMGLALRQARWGWAAAAGLAAGLIRPNGLALVVLAVGLVLPGLRSSRGGDLLGRVAAVVSPMAGFGVFLLAAGRWHGDPWSPVSAQSPLRGELVDPVTRLVRGVGDLFGDERLGDGLHLPFALVAIVLVALVLRHVGRSEAAYTAAVVLVAISADNWNSLERYLLNAFPIFWALGVVTGSRLRERWLLVVGASGLVALTVLAWTGDYVP
jgi:hypothetical protein